MSRADESASEWARDVVRTRAGVQIPVRATARRPIWHDLPLAVRRHVEEAAGSTVVEAWSAGTGFTPGFASRLALADGRDIFVKAASSAQDRLHGWALSAAYREEARKLNALGPAIGAPALLWSADVESEDERWVLLGLEYVDARPPRRPWRPDELGLVLDKLTAIAPNLAHPPDDLALPLLQDDVVAGFEDRLDRIRALTGDTDWLDRVEQLCDEADDLLAGHSLVHLDLRDDNVLIADDGRVWFVDWNFPAIGAPWVDLVCIVLSARGDGHDADSLLAGHPLTRDVDPHAVDVLLAVLWSYWGIAQTEPIPVHSPHLRDHQTWYADVTQAWLLDRLASAPVADSSAPARGFTA